MIISVILQSRRLKRADVLKVIRAINRQIREDFEPYWSFGGRLRLEGMSDETADATKAVDMRGDAVLYLVDDVPASEDALGFHEANFAGVPYGFVMLELCRKLKESWSVTLSHEALELLGDSQANLLVKGPHPHDRKRDVFHWFEMCDAVQQDTYQIDGVGVANFVLPLYFTVDGEPGSRNDFLGLTKGGELDSFGVRPGGYVGFYDPEKGDDDSVFADQRALQRAAIKAKLSIGRSQYRKRGKANESRTAFLQRMLPSGLARGAVRSGARLASGRAAGVDPFRHIVVLCLENRSFDHMLGDFASVDAACEGVVRGVNARFNDTTGFGRILQAANTTGTFPKGIDPRHEVEDVRDQIAIRQGVQMGGFAQNFADSYGKKLSGAAMKTALHQVMGFFPMGSTAALDSLPVLQGLARQFVVCDHWHASVPGPTWTNRFFLLSGTSRGFVEMPSTGNLSPLFRSYSQETIFDRLDSVKRSWKIYHDGIPQSLVLSRLHGRLGHYHGMDKFFQDCAGSADAFPEFAFIEPRYFGSRENSQHPPSNIRAGEELLGSIYKALRSNQALWESTLFVVTYDEHGGFYDHFTPGAALPPDNLNSEYTFDQLGVRVPTLLISPWLDRGLLHQTYDHTSLLKHLAVKWGFAPLGNRAATALDFADEWSALLRSTPRTDTPLSVAGGGRGRRVRAVAPSRVDASEQLEGSRGALVLYAENCLPEVAGAAPPARAKRGRRASARPAGKDLSRVDAAEAKVLALLRQG
jgi:phospholipase C